MTAMTKEAYRKALLNPWAFVLKETKALGITAIAMSEATGLGRSTTRAYLNGYRKAPRVAQLNAMLYYVLKRKGEKVPKRRPPYKKG